MFKIQEYNISVDLIGGYQFMDKIGAVIQSFRSKENRGVPFQVIQNPQGGNELIINNLMQSDFRVSINNISLSAVNITNPNMLLEHIKYFISKVKDIIDIINVKEFSKISVNFRMKIDEETYINKIKTNFHKSNVKYFSHVFNEMRLTDNIQIGLKMFTGVVPSIQQITPNIGLMNANVSVSLNQSNSTMYILEADVFSKSIADIPSSNLESEFDKIINHSIKNENLKDEVEKFIFE